MCYNKKPMKLNLLTIPDARLRREAKNISIEELRTPSVQKLIDDMAETMLASDGIGLASTQIDVLWRIFVITLEDGVMAFVNPKIIKKSLQKKVDEEGCLSVPDIWGTVKRPYSVALEALDRYGEPVRLEASGLLARVIQHEYDHLDGILFIDKVKKITRGADNLKKLLES